MPHAALCVSGPSACPERDDFLVFQCRTRHYMCRDQHRVEERDGELAVSMPHAALCVSGPFIALPYMCTDMFQCRTQHCVCRDIHSVRLILIRRIVSMPHAALCVSGRSMYTLLTGMRIVSMPHAALCVSGPIHKSLQRPLHPRFNAACSIVCVGTLCPAALVPRGLHRFGKTKRRNAALRQRRSTFHFLLLYDSTRFVLFQ